MCQFLLFLLVSEIVKYLQMQIISIGVEFLNFYSSYSLFSSCLEHLHINNCWLHAGPQVVEFTLCLCHCTSCVCCCGDHLETTTEYS